jgi:hypothetical protein
MLDHLSVFVHVRKVCEVAVAGWNFTSTGPGWVPPEIDTTVAHSARAYDYWLGGKTHFEADRVLAEAVIAAVPTMRHMARANRAFLGRAVGFLAREADIDQFLAIGAGIPGPGSVHEVARTLIPGVAVQYVDNDPVVLAHGRALTADTNGDRTGFLLADLHDPADILAKVAESKILDLDRPVGLLLVSVLMLLRDDDRPYEVVGHLMDALPSGSCLAISHPTADFDPAAMAQAVRANARSGLTLTPRSHAETERFFTGLDLFTPLVAPVRAWRPESPPDDPRSAWYWAGVGRNP